MLVHQRVCCLVRLGMSYVLWHCHCCSGCVSSGIRIPGWESRLSFGMFWGFFGMGRIALAILVGGLEHGCCFSIIYGMYWDVILPIDFHIFQVGFLTTNQNQAFGLNPCWLVRSIQLIGAKYLHDGWNFSEIFRYSLLDPSGIHNSLVQVYRRLPSGHLTWPQSGLMTLFYPIQHLQDPKSIIIDMGMSENGVYSQWNSHLVGIMIMKTIGCRGTLFSDKPI